MTLIVYWFQFGSALGLNWSAMSMTVMANRSLKNPVSRGKTNSVTKNSWFYSIVCHPLITPMPQLEKQ